MLGRAGVGLPWKAQRPAGSVSSPWPIAGQAQSWDRVSVGPSVFCHGSGTEAQRPAGPSPLTVPGSGPHSTKQGFTRTPNCQALARGHHHILGGLLPPRAYLTNTCTHACPHLCACPHLLTLGSGGSPSHLGPGDTPAAPHMVKVTQEQARGSQGLGLGAMAKPTCAEPSSVCRRLTGEAGP